MPELELLIALTLRVEKDGSAIVIESWELNDGRPHRTQRVTMEKTGKEKVKVSGPLTIPFEKLFLRKGDIPREKDIEMNTDMLKSMSRIIWRNLNVE